jgi:hypothetical protein
MDLGWIFVEIDKFGCLVPERLLWDWLSMILELWALRSTVIVMNQGSDFGDKMFFKEL